MADIKGVPIGVDAKRREISERSETVAIRRLGCHLERISDRWLLNTNPGMKYQCLVFIWLSTIPDMLKNTR